MDQNCKVNTGSVAEKHKLNTEEVFELNFLFEIITQSSKNPCQVSLIMILDSRPTLMNKPQSTQKLYHLLMTKC